MNFLLVRLLILACKYTPHYVFDHRYFGPKIYIYVCAHTIHIDVRFLAYIRFSQRKDSFFFSLSLLSKDNQQFSMYRTIHLYYQPYARATNRLLFSSVFSNFIWRFLEICRLWSSHRSTNNITELWFCLFIASLAPFTHPYKRSFSNTNSYVQGDVRVFVCLRYGFMCILPTNMREGKCTDRE